MALFDFLSKPVGGRKQPSNLEGISENSQGKPRTNMNWGQFISFINSLDTQSPQGSNLTNNPFSQFNQGSINQSFNQSNVPYLQSSLGSLGKGSQGDNQDISEIMQLISLFGGGLGAAGGALGPSTTMTGTGMFAG